MDTGSGADKTIQSFLNSLKISLGNASIYAADHPVLLGSLEELQNKLYDILIFFNSIEIFVAPNYLLIDQIKWEKDEVHKYLSHFFHIRNIKSIKITKGVLFEELRYFIIKVSLIPVNILTEGGMPNILKNGNIIHVFADMLDYSEIIEGTKTDENVWAFLLRQAVEDERADQIDALVANFGRMFINVGVKNIWEGGEFAKGLEIFLKYLQKRNRETFVYCLQLALQVVSREKDIIEEKPIPDMLKGLLGSLDTEELSDVLLEKLLISEDSDFVILKIFDQFVSPEQHKMIAGSLSNRIERTISSQINLEWLKKLNNLFLESSQRVIAEVYSPVIIYYIEKFSREDVFRLNKKAWPCHYRAILFELFDQEKGEDDLRIIIDKLLGEWTRIVEKKESKYLQDITRLCKRKKVLSPDFQSLLMSMENGIIKYMEESLLLMDDAGKVDHFFDDLERSVLGPGVYLDHIFEQDSVRPVLLKAFFKFHGGNTPLFYKKLRTKLLDTQFILTFIEGVKELEPVLQLDILENIFLCPNIYIKKEVLTIMSKLSIRDYEFLLIVLTRENSDMYLREQCLLIIVGDEAAKKKAIDLLLSERGPFKGHNSLLIENIRIVGNLDLKEAVQHLLNLTKKSFFWNKGVRNAATTVLEKLGHGKN